MYMGRFFGSTQILVLNPDPWEAGLGMIESFEVSPDFQFLLGYWGENSCYVVYRLLEGSVLDHHLIVEGSHFYNELISQCGSSSNNNNK